MAESKPGTGCLEMPTEIMRKKRLEYDAMTIEKTVYGKDNWKAKARDYLKNNDPLKILDQYNSEVRRFFWVYFFDDTILRLFAKNGARKNENKALCKMADRSSVSGPAIVLADRNYGSLNNLAHMENRGWDYVIRLKERGSVFGVQLPNHPMFDVPVTLTLVRISKCQLEKAGASVPENYCHITRQRTFGFLAVGSAEFCTLHFRIVRIEIGDGKTETMITNLNPQKFPPDDLKALGH